jgi:hypothetical protein
MRLIRIAVLGTLPALLAGIAFAFALGAGRPASAANEAMAVDCDASTSAVDAACSYGPGATFQMSVHATNAGDGYAGYQVRPHWTDATLDYLPSSEPGTENKWTEPCLAARPENPPDDSSLLFGCFTLFGTTSTNTGPLAEFQMQCQTPGTTAISILSSDDEPDHFGTELYDSLGTAIAPALTGASVTCLGEGGTPTPTNTPTPISTEGPSPTPGTGTPTATPTMTPPGVTPTVTPTVATPTRTPTPGGGMKGDANGDGNTNSIDAAIVLQYTAGLVSSLPNLANADTNHDGAVDSIDAALILQIDAGLLPQPA